MLKSEKYNSFFDKFVYFFLLFSPIIDVLTAIFVKNTDLPFSIGTIIRGIFLLLVIIWLKNNTPKNKRLLLIFVLYVVLACMYYFGLFKTGFVTEVNNLFHIFYLPLMMLFFSKYNNNKINDKLVLKIYLIYLNLIIIPYIFGVGYNLSEVYSNKEGYFGLFYGGNELSAVLVLLGFISLNYVNKSKSYILKIFTYIELFVCIYLIGTKTLYLGTIITFIYFLVNYIKYARIFKTNKSKKWLIIPVLFVISLIVIIPKTPMVKNVKTTLDYYGIKEVSDVFNIKNIDNLVFSKRLSNLGRISNLYVNGKVDNLIYGIGKTEIEKRATIEIDIFDIVFSIGIFGTFIYVLMLLYTIKFHGLNNRYRFIFIIMILISFLSGHVLIKPMVSIYLALLYLLSKNSVVMEKKKILLVSNMYPSDKYKYYGSFVKNTGELLEKNGFDVDKIVITKQTEKIAKLFSYVYLHLGTIFKGIFNNYDYLYVHFISHSSLGAVFTKRTCSDVKLLLNAHGNDIVSDFDDTKNIKRSSKYLKYADKVICPSNYFKDVIVKEYKIDKDKIYVYPSGGVDTNKFKKLDRKECLKEANLSDKYNYIGFASRLEKDKGYDVFLKAIKYLKDKNLLSKEDKFLVVGTGSEESKFNELVNELDISEYLEIRNMVSQDELISIYNSLDIFVFPTYRKSESLGLVGLEAMACEVLVIASKNYGPTDYLVDNKNGKFFKPKDYKDLANKIIEMKKLNNEEKKKMRKKARETSIKYDTKNTKELILKVFE